MQPPIDQTGKWTVNVHSNCPPTKFDAIPSGSSTKSPMGMNNQCNTQESTKSLQRSYSVESMDSDTDRIVASF